MHELRIGEGPLEAVVLPEAGARLHRLRAFGDDLLRTPDDPAVHLADPFFWGAYVMAPWCNRIPAEPQRVGALIVDLPANFPDGTAIHGQVYARPWTVDGDEFRVNGGADGWPWPYEMRMRVIVAGQRLRLDCALTNRSPEPMPAGVGLHPWWRRPVRLSVPGEAVYTSNVDPISDPKRVAPPFDLGRLVPPADGLDATWTDLRGKTVVLSWPNLGVDATMTLSTSLSHVAVATPPTVDAIAVEPQTHAPGGLGRMLRAERGGLALLAAGASLAATIEMEVRRR